MAAKVRQIRDVWYVVTHNHGSRQMTRVGPTKADRKRADRIAEKINGALAIGMYEPEAGRPLKADAELRSWHKTHLRTMKPSYAALTAGLIENHLVPKPPC